MIIGIAGYKSSGKDTAGSVLVDKFGFKKMSFAKPIKDLVAQTFDMDRFMLEGSDCKMRTIREDVNAGFLGKSPREILQVIGTGFRDLVHQDIWVKLVEDQCNPEENYVLTDVRFPNEVEMINNNGFVVGIKRPGFSGDQHISERALDNIALPYIINNDKSICELKVAMYNLMAPKLRG